MPTQVQFRRGTSTQNNSFTGAVGEISVDTTNQTLRVHDGSTAGGSTLVSLNATQTIANKTLSNLTISGALAGLTLSSTLTGTTINAATIGNTGANIVGFLTTGAQTSINQVGSLLSLNVIGTATVATLGANIVVAATIGNTGALLTGTLQTAAQTNVTSLGTLTGLTLSGTLTGTTVNAATIGNTGAALTGTTVTASGAINGPLNGTLGAAGGNTAIVSTLTATGNATVSALTVNNSATIAGTLGVTGNVVIAGNLTVANVTYLNQEILSSTEVVAANLTTNGLTVNTSGVFSTTLQALGGLQATPIGNAATSSAKFTTVDASGAITGATTLVTTGSAQHSALTVNAAANIGTDLTVIGNLFVGPGANTSAFTNPIFIGIDSGSGYVQAAVVNTFGNASADFTAYANNGTDVQGWMDMGMTGNVFNDSKYTITGFNDGYIFANGVTGNSSLGGNLVIATGSGGATNDIVFGTGGFLAANERFRFVNATNVLKPSANATMGVGTSTAYMGTGYFNAIQAPSITGVLQTAAQTNITSVGTLTSLTVSGATTVVGTLTTNGITPSGNANANIGSAALQYNTVFAKATSAQYADLAEVYTSDANYAPGTVVVFGGDAEVTISTAAHDTAVAGVVSTNPAYLMNSTCDGVAVALQGRVPCQVRGPVNKGDVLVTSDIAGVAQKIDYANYKPGCVIGKALATVANDTVATIEVVVGRF